MRIDDTDARPLSSSRLLSPVTAKSATAAAPDSASEQSTAPPADAKSMDLPAWYPAWARELAELYFSGTTCLFVLHGNVHDLIRCPAAAGDRGQRGYCNLSEFLATQVFGSWDVVLRLRSEPRPAAAGRRRRRNGCRR